VEQAANEALGMFWDRLDGVRLSLVDRMAKESEYVGVAEIFIAGDQSTLLELAQRVLAATNCIQVRLLLEVAALEAGGDGWLDALGRIADEYPSRVNIGVRISVSQLASQSQFEYVQSRLLAMLPKAEGDAVDARVVVWLDDVAQLDRVNDVEIPVMCNFAPTAELLAGSNAFRNSTLVGAVLGNLNEHPGTTVSDCDWQQGVHSQYLGPKIAGMSELSDTLDLSREDSAEPVLARRFAPIIRTDFGVNGAVDRYFEYLTRLTSEDRYGVPQRMTRFIPSILAADQREIYDRIRYGSRSKGKQVFRLMGDDEALEGPFNTWLVSPRIGAAHERFGDVMRFGCTIDPRWREIAIVIVGAYWGSKYERYAHEALAHQVGLSEEEIRSLCEGMNAELHDVRETLVARFSWTILMHHGFVDDEFYLLVERELGEVALFEITTLVGYYSMLALQLEVFRVNVPLASKHHD
jgi:4-carboxymuconolactone decarboxylase